MCYIHSSPAGLHLPGPGKLRVHKCPTAARWSTQQQACWPTLHDSTARNRPQRQSLKLRAAGMDAMHLDVYPRGLGPSQTLGHVPQACKLLTPAQHTWSSRSAPLEPCRPRGAQENGDMGEAEAGGVLGASVRNSPGARLWAWWEACPSMRCMRL